MAAFDESRADDLDAMEMRWRHAETEELIEIAMDLYEALEGFFADVEFVGSLSAIPDDAIILVRAAKFKCAMQSILKARA